MFFRKAYGGNPSLGTLFTNASHAVKILELVQVISVLPTLPERRAYEELFEFVTETPFEVCLKTSSNHREVRF
jgi:hypothetical protein